MAEGSKKLYLRICVDCHKAIYTPGRCTKRCPECNEIHKEIYSRERRERDKMLRIRKANTANESSARLWADVRKAEALGLSYGKMRIQEMLQAQKGTS